ncbi:MAG: hypothetical protein HRU15_11800 [Planctomycetes bacterium]|nr:hypothetical protein [Planctomycetota bacterium]
MVEAQPQPSFRFAVRFELARREPENAMCKGAPAAESLQSKVQEHRASIAAIKSSLRDRCGAQRI